MLKIDRNLESILRELKHFDARIVRPGVVSYGFLRPGDIVLFQYPEINKEFRMGLVVTNDTGHIGYTSMRGNRLLSIFRLNDAPIPLIKMIFRNLYKREDVCNRRTIVRSLSSLVGYINYRTYKLSGMVQMHKINVHKERIKLVAKDIDELEELDLE